MSQGQCLLYSVSLKGLSEHLAHSRFSVYIYSANEMLILPISFKSCRVFMESLENRPLVHCYVQSIPNKGQLIHLHIYQIYIKSKWKPVISGEEHQSIVLIMTFYRASFSDKTQTKETNKKDISILLLHEDHEGSRRLTTVEIIYSEIASVNFNLEKAFNMDE